MNESNACILEILQKQEQPVTAPCLRRLLAAAGVEISISALYRALEELYRDGAVTWTTTRRIRRFAAANKD